MYKITNRLIQGAGASIGIPAGVSCIVRNWPKYCADMSALSFVGMLIGVWATLAGLNWALAYVLDGIEVKGNQSINIALIKPENL